MQLFNVTFITDDQVGKVIESWIRQTHLPIVDASGLFISARLLKVVNPRHDGITYCMQFISENEEAISTYKQQFMPTLTQKAQEEYKEHLFLIESLMEFID